MSLGHPAPRASSWLTLVMLGLIAVPAFFALRTVRAGPPPAALSPEPSPYGYTVSLLFFLLPSCAVLLWLAFHKDIHVSKKSLLWTVALLFPAGALLDFFFASDFFVFPNPGATLGIGAPALHRPVPVEEYVFYLAGFLCVTLFYIWLDEYWLEAYSVPSTAELRINFRRLLGFHPHSALLAIVLISAAIEYRRRFVPQLGGFPGYFAFLVLIALVPSSILLSAARPVVNWRAFSLTAVLVVCISLLWEVTLALPYGWWDFRDQAMIGVRVVAWHRLPIEEPILWVAVTYASVLVYEVVKRWKASGRRAAHAFLGMRTAKSSGADLA